MVLVDLPLGTLPAKNRKNSNWIWTESTCQVQRSPQWLIVKPQAAKWPNHSLDGSQSCLPIGPMWTPFFLLQRSSWIRLHPSRLWREQRCRRPKAVQGFARNPVKSAFQKSQTHVSVQSNPSSINQKRYGEKHKDMKFRHLQQSLGLGTKIKIIFSCTVMTQHHSTFAACPPLPARNISWLGISLLGQ